MKPRQEFGFTSILSPQGDFKKYTGKELAVYRLLVLLSIPEGSYINDPDLGINLIKYVYQPMVESVYEGIRNEIKSKIERYEKDLIFSDLKFVDDVIRKNVYIELHLIYRPTMEKMVLSLDFMEDMKSLKLKIV